MRPPSMFGAGGFLTRQQVEEYGLPTASPKATDARSRWWSGETCQFETPPPYKLAKLLYEAFHRALKLHSSDRPRCQQMTTNEPTLQTISGKCGET